MKTLRLLLWLRWTTFLRATSAGNRAASLFINILFAFMFSPLWLGGAVAAYAGVRSHGAPAVIVAFGLCQLGWLYFGMLSGALGRSFDLDRWLRWPVRPRTVYAFNIVATLVEPVCLMTLPTLVAVALASAARGGPAAALAALAGGLLLTLLTASLLQLLLAVLDEMLRLEWVRYVALALLPLTFLGIQFSMRHYASDLAQRVLHGSLAPERALAFGSAFFSRVPTVIAPAALATGALEHAPLRAALGLLAALALLVLALLPGASLMRRTARGGENAGGGRPARRSTRGSFGVPLPGVPRPVALLFARELRATFQIPQRLVSTIQTPLLILVIAFVNGRVATIHPLMIVAMMTSAISTASLLQFSYDGPGVRTYFLLPLRPRDVLLAKNLEFLARLLFQLVLVFAGYLLFAHSGWSFGGASLALASVAVLATVLAIGTWSSVRNPVRARNRGLMTRSSGTGWGGFFVFLGSLAVAFLVFGGLWAVGRLVPAPWTGLSELATSVVFAALGVALWWRSLDRNAELMAANREKLIEVLARLEAA